MKRTWTIIGVADVPRRFGCYKSSLVVRAKTPAHDSAPCNGLLL